MNPWLLVGGGVLVLLASGKAKAGGSGGGSGGKYELVDRRVDNRFRTRPMPKQILIHTTSYGIADIMSKRLKKQGKPVTERAIDDLVSDFYINQGGTVMGSAMIGISPTVYVHASPNRVTHHAATYPKLYGQADWYRWAAPCCGGALVEHNRDGRSVYDWWFTRWPGLSTPLQIPGADNCNLKTYGFDFRPTMDPKRLGDVYTPDQIDRGAHFIAGVCREMGVTAGDVKQANVYGHADACPAQRGTVLSKGQIIGSDWDPGKNFPWDDFRNLLRSYI